MSLAMEAMPAVGTGTSKVVGETLVVDNTDITLGGMDGGVISSGVCT
ncbi:MAG: hypothetical protein ACOYM3_13580 [Terrimicrobiaceae bacterium]